MDDDRAGSVPAPSESVGSVPALSKSVGSVPIVDGLANAAGTEVEDVVSSDSSVYSQSIIVTKT